MNTAAAKKTFPFLLAMIPAAFTAWAVMRYAIYFPFADDWALMSVLNPLHHGTAGFQDFWRQHNEHRILTAKLIHGWLAMATRWDLRYPIALNFGVAAAAWAGLYGLILREKETLGEKNLLWLPAAVSVFVFSFRQHENWAWPSELVCFFSSLGGVLCVLLLSRPEFRWRSVFLSVFCGVFASCSFTTGLMVWPAGFFLLLFCAGDRRTKALLLWCVAGGAVFAFWMSGYVRPPHHPGLTADVLKLSAYFFRYLGSVLAPRAETAFWYGAAGFVLYLLVSIKLFFFRSGVPARVTAAFASLGLFAIINGAVTAVGRAGFGIDQSMAPRYVTFSYLFWVSLLLLISLAGRALNAVEKRTPLMNVSGFLCLFLSVWITLAAGLASLNSFPEMPRHQKRVHRAALQLLEAPATANLSPVYPTPADIKESIQLLREWKFNIFDPAQEARLRQWALSRRSEAL